VTAPAMLSLRPVGAVAVALLLALAGLGTAAPAAASTPAARVPQAGAPVT
jgi:hypothetical protein